MFAGKHIVLGVTGGIAAYKAAHLVRELVKAGAEVQVTMTPAAAEFITPLTLGTLSRRPVLSAIFPPAGGQDQWTRHIELGLWADVMLVAPASANTIAKLAHGLADNFLTTIALALRCPLAVAPTMDVDMYRHPATQGNIAVLRSRGVHIIEPESGELASGLSGPGRLPDTPVLLDALREILVGARGDLSGRRVLVTAGPTQEPIDPVRYIGNRSSGKMGFAIAEAAARRGAETTLVAGPVHLPTPAGVARVDVGTAEEMRRAVLAAFPSADVVVMAAAVADFAPARPAPGKIKRGAQPEGRLTLELRANPDILGELGERATGQVLVGFALETEDGPDNARRKLLAKRLAMVVLNNPLEEGAGFGADTNRVTILTAGGSPERLPLLSKTSVAHEILSRIVPLLTH